MRSYVELKAKSAYSLLEGALRVKELGKLCAARGMPALGVADTDNLFGSLEISEELAKAGVQPIIGCAMSLKRDEGAGARRPMNASPGAVRPRLAVYPKSEAGYLALLKLASKARVENDAVDPFITLENLAAAGPDLLILTGGPEGPIQRLIVEGQASAAEALLDRLAEIAPGRLYIELQRHALAAEARAEGTLIDWAYDKRLPLVATNEPYFATPDLHQAHDALLCVAGNTLVVESARRRLTAEHWFKGAAEMVPLFADLPEAIEMTLEVARRVAVRPKKRQPILPRFEVSSGESEAAALARLATQGLTRRLGETPAAAPEATYRERLAYELGVIERMGFPGYFLIVADFIAWAKARGIPVGPGRGSGAGSLVAYALTITDLDPLRFGLLFERFLNPERISMPDFDIDFCPVRREEVFGYVREKYGADRVAQIISFGKLLARAVLRDVGRVLAMSYGQVDRLCKLVPNNPANPLSLAQAIAGEPRLQAERDKDESVARLLGIAQQLEGLYRHSSTHAAGVVIGDRPLEELIPVTRDPASGMLVTQLDMKWVEPAGLIKFDFLALKTLTVLQRTVEFLKARGITLELSRLPLDDAKTFVLLGTGDATGIFQLEGSGMRDVLRKLKPSSIGDLIALVALYRPGPMDDIPRYIACKHGREPVDCLDPRLEPVLKETFGVIVYQEQAMEIARVLAGYSLGEADLLRRAMSKKIKSEMAQQKERFVSGAAERGLKPDRAEFIFDLIAKFAGYGFNKCHSAPYALVAYQTAYMKANHPLEFMAATMSLDINQTEKLALLRRDAIEIGCRVLPPDINRSQADFSVEDGTIVYGLAAIKNVGHQAMAELVAERERGGPFTDIFDFAQRVAPPTLNRRVLETLAKAGVFDAIHPDRGEIVQSAEMLVAFGARAAEERVSRQVSLFGEAGSAPERPRLAKCAAWSLLERLQNEAEAVGYYLSGHPLDEYAAVLKRARVTPYAELARAGRRLNRRVDLAGTVIRKQERRSQKNDQPFAFVEFTDPTGHFEAVVFSDLLREHREALEPGRSVVLTADAEWEGEDLRLRVQNLRALDSLAAETGAGLRIFIDSTQPLESIATHLEGKANGKGPVSFVVLDGAGREVEIELKARYGVNPRVRSLLKSVPGVLEVEEL
jgi:DNA polymerase-3 subunit alpha